MNGNLKQAYLALLWETLALLFLSLFSGPIADSGLTTWLSFNLEPARRVARIVFVYHAVAVPFVCFLLFLALYSLKIQAKEVLKTATTGYILTGVGGLGFAYFVKEWYLHGLFIFGLSLVFFSGILFLVRLWRLFQENPSLQSFAFLLTTLFILISVSIGGVVASYFGQGFTAFLAEDVLRQAHNLLQRAVISHLHIMLALIDTFLLLLIVSQFDLKERAKNLILLLIIIGTFVITLGTWSVMPFEKIAHRIINFGSFFLLLPAAIVGVWGFKKGCSDAPTFGLAFYLIAVNFFVTIPGIYVAVNLEKLRNLPFSIERTFAVGHWHVLATITAVMAFLLLVRLTLSGMTRQLVGWLATIGSATSFTAILFYLASPQTFSISIYFVEIGLLSTLLSVVIFLVRERELFWYC
jgi:hypothetical protein